MDYKKYPGKTIKKYNILLNNSDPIISIITPYYNAGSTIDETYNSIMSQTYPFYEWIIIDDGSKDKESLKKLKEIEGFNTPVVALTANAITGMRE